MAKRRKKRSHTRRRRISGVGKIDVQGLLLAVGGAVLASNVQKMLAKDATKTTLVTIAPFSGLALGLGLPLIVKNPMVTALAGGAAIWGGVQVVKKLAPALVGNIPGMVPIISATSNKYRNLPKPSVNGVAGTTLPMQSAFKS